VRRVYFSFDYERDLDRVNKIRAVPGMVVGSAAGFHNADVWETAARRGDAAIQGLIKDAMNNTTVTVVCLGHMTAYRKHLTFELEQSLNRGNGVLGVKINHLTNKEGEADEEGYVPPLIKIAGYNIYKYSNQRQLAKWIEEAAEIATEQAQREHQRNVSLRQKDGD
jgi:hypothetical protein